MNLFNKLEITKGKYYLVSNKGEIESLYTGDITNYFNIPMLQLPSKAVAKFKYYLNKEETKLAEVKADNILRSDKKLISLISARIASYNNIISKLMNHVDSGLIGIYPKGEDDSTEYVITPYNEVLVELQKNTRWVFTEISEKEFNRLCDLWAEQGLLEEDEEDEQQGKSETLEKNNVAPMTNVESTETKAEEETELTLGEKIVFGIFITVALPIIFYPFTFLAILYWSANPFNVESAFKFIGMMIATVGTLLAFKIMTGEVEVKPTDKSKDKHVKFSEIDNNEQTNNSNIINRKTEESKQEGIEQDSSNNGMVIFFIVILSAIAAANFWASYTDPENKTGLDVAEDFLFSTFSTTHGAEYLNKRAIEGINYKN